MSRSRFVTVLLLLVWTGCAADGGQRGTGITSLEGNVVAIQSDAAAVAAPAGAAPAVIAPTLAGISVSIEGTNLHAQTNVDGRFVVQGTFAGDTAVRFDRDGDGISARTTVNAPAGGTTTLRDVTLQLATGAASATAIYVKFEGRAVGLDCAADRMTCVSAESQDDAAAPYVIVLTEASLADEEGRPLTCGDLAVGDLMEIDGAYAQDGSIEHARVTRH